MILFCEVFLLTDLAWCRECDSNASLSGDVSCKSPLFVERQSPMVLGSKNLGRYSLHFGRLSMTRPESSRSWITQTSSIRFPRMRTFLGTAFAAWYEISVGASVWVVQQCTQCVSEILVHVMFNSTYTFMIYWCMKHFFHHHFYETVISDDSSGYLSTFFSEFHSFSRLVQNIAFFFQFP